VPGDAAAVLEVVQPGLLTTIQDAGRRGHRQDGVPVAGAADPVALAVANILAGNEPGAAALECTLLGPLLAVLRPVFVAVAGADLGARILPSGHALTPRTGTWLEAGERLVFEPSPDRRASGCRAYLAVRGGFDVPVVLGSRSTSLVGGFGGLGGRALRAGDVLATGASGAGQASVHALAWPPDLELPGNGAAVRVLPGPALDGLPDATRTFAAFIDTAWTAAMASDRRGVRLDGPPLPAPGSADLGSHGVLPGTVQVTPSGQPLILLADAGTTGGYPVLGVVIEADLGLVAQARPGDRLSFEATDLATARAASIRLRATLEQARARLGTAGS
jgi:antagonist of KipI